MNILSSVETLITASGTTQPEKGAYMHPARSFLDLAGIPSAQFPQIRLILELPDRTIRPHKICIPLKIPGTFGAAYESFLRVTRVMELPSPQGGWHRRFIELEWSLETEAVDEFSIHHVSHFLASEIQCPTCRMLFVPVLRKVDTQSAQISCPQCEHRWAIHINSESQSQIPLLLDQYQKDPAATRNMVSSWTQHPISPTDTLYFEFFPYSFERLESNSALNMIWGDDWVFRVQANTSNPSFENLLRAMVNTIAFQYLKTQTGSRTLETTEVQAKSSPIEKDFEQPMAKIEAIKVNAPKTLKKAPRKNSPAKWAMGLAALAIFGISFGILRSVKWPSSETLPMESSSTKIEAQKDTPQTPVIHQPASLQPSTQNAEPPKVALKESLQIPQVKAQVPSTPKEKVETSPSSARQKVLAKNNEAEEFYRQGMLHLRFQQGKEAAEEFEKALRLNPKHTASYRSLGLAYVYDQKFEAAIEAFEKYLKLAPKNQIDRPQVQDLLDSIKTNLKQKAALQAQQEP